MKERPEIPGLLRSAGVLYVRGTALNPILWLVAVVIGGALIAGWSAGWTSPIGYGAAGLVVVCVLAALGAYFFLLFRDPDRLQSEKYQLQIKALQMLVPKEGPALDPETVEVLPNPLATDGRNPGADENDEGSSADVRRVPDAS